MNKEIENIINRIVKYRKIDTTTKCWEWTGYCKSSSKTDQIAGYPVIKLKDRRNYKVQRVIAWLVLGMPINMKIDTCHTCDNRKCINPLHIFLGTRKDNITDALDKGRMANQYGAFKSNHYQGFGN